MAKFSFEARGADGKNYKGELDAGNEAEARVKLRAQRLVPVRVSAKTQARAATGPTKSNFSGKVNSKDLQIFTRQLSTLLSSGIPILQSLETLSQSGARPTVLQRAVKEVCVSLAKGRRLGDAVGDFPTVFDRFYANMVRAAEESGQLDVVLSRLATYIEKSVKIKGKIKSAMLYPVIIIFVAGGVISAIMIFVIPKFQDLFKGAGQKLPALTEWVIACSHFFTSFWYLIFGGIFGFVMAISSYYKTPAGREQIDHIMIEIPLLGDLIRKGGIARFTRTLSTLLSSGVGIMEGLDISSRVVGSVVLEKAIIRARDAIAEGKSIVTPLAREKHIPSMVVQMIGVGEQTGNLDQMLGKIADFYEDEVDVTVGALTSVMEPMLMVVLGIIIAVLVIAMYLPIFNLAGAVTGT
jgi:type IV pilus assembly protein PilC